jgi:cytochrome c peroxidase
MRPAKRGGFWFAVGVVALQACSSEREGPAGPAEPSSAAPATEAAVPVAAGAAASPTATADSAEASAGFNPRLLRRFAKARASIESEANPLTPEKIALGRMLFFDPRLSRDNDISCNSCHSLSSYGSDGAKTSLGEAGQRGTRNSPTVYHAAGLFAAFWDGRAANVEEQALLPILNPKEMAMPDAPAVVRRLQAIPGYVQAFERAFPGEERSLSFQNLGRAIGAFERKLVTSSRWDDYVGGNNAALTATEVNGLRAFTNLGCMVCHTGEFVGGNSYQRVGAVDPWPNQQDQGRFDNTRDPADRMMFRVPTLRNIAKTAPYFHDGSAATLEQAVHDMGRHQLGLSLSSLEISSIVAWLNSLTGELPLEYIKEPALPPNPPAPGAVAASSAPARD